MGTGVPAVITRLGVSVAKLSDNQIGDRLYAALEAIGTDEGETIRGNTALVAARQTLSLLEQGLLIAAERNSDDVSVLRTSPLSRRLNKRRMRVINRRGGAGGARERGLVVRSFGVADDSFPGHYTIARSAPTHWRAAGGGHNRISNTYVWFGHCARSPAGCGNASSCSSTAPRSRMSNRPLRK
jgi:hypothetical protein